MAINSLQDLYLEELKDLYSAEKQLVKALPKMAKNAANPKLQQAFTDHLRQTEGHVERLEQIFEMLGAGSPRKKCKGMEGLIEEARELLEEDAPDEVIDAGLISKAQHVEHYEMAGYGTVRTYARQLGLDKQAQLLQQTLDEEGKANDLLTKIAESSVNVQAESESDESITSSRRPERAVSRGVASETTGSRKSGSRGSRGSSRTGEATAR